MLNSLIDIGYGFLICWLLNMVQLAIAFILLASSERMLAYVYVLTTALGIIQVGYIVPIYRLLRRKGKPMVARGLLIAASMTAVATISIDFHFFPYRMLHFWR